ncbi:MAG: hypothetical protein CSB15_00375 [Clostridiales bacterium]|nr:MAG: hypothetical protein CSB15_00375 [Clostridiales bacterium]
MGNNVSKWNYKRIAGAIGLLIAILVLLILSIRLMYKSKPDFKVSIDVSSSIEFEVDKKLKVVKVNTVGEEMKDFAKGLRLKNVRLKTAIDEVIRKMIEQKKIKDREIIFVKVVDGKNNLRLLETERTVVFQIASLIPKKLKGIGVVSYATVSEQDKDISDAKEKEVSVSKIMLVNEIFKSYTKKSIRTLLKLDMKDLYDIIVNNNIDMPKLKYVDCSTENDLKAIKDRQYVSTEKALNGVLKLLKTYFEKIYRVSIKASLFDKQPVYYIGFIYGDKNYNFIVSATTGKPIKLDISIAKEFSESENSNVDIKNLKENVKTPIGTDMAFDAVLKYLKLSKADIELKHIDFGLIKGNLVYEVTFVYRNNKKTIKVEAYNGDIITNEDSLEDNTKEDADDSVKDTAEALSIALNQEKLKESEIILDSVKLDKENKKYIVKFAYKNNDCYYEISAESGKILNYKKEKREEDDKILSEDEIFKSVCRDENFKISETDLKKATLNKDKNIYTLIVENSKIEYTYEVDAITGKIKSFSKKANGENKNPKNTQENFISKDAIIDFVLLNAGLIRKDLVVESVILDKKKAIYYVALKYNGKIYNYEVDAITGEDRSKKSGQINQGKDEEKSILTPDEAFSLVLKKVNLIEDDVNVKDIKFNKAKKTYKVVFSKDKKEYIYEVDAINSKVLKLN